MNRDDADRLLAALGGAHDRIAAAMYAIDSHQALGFLRGGGLLGRTATRATALVGEVDVLWSRFSMIGEALEQSRAIRATRRPSDREWSVLVALLTGPVVVVDPTGVPVLAPPDLTAGGRGGPPPRAPQYGPIGVRIRLTDLIGQVQGRCNVAYAQLSETDVAWSAASRAVAPLTEAMNTLAALARDLGDTVDAVPLERRTTVLRDGVLADPLAAAPAGQVAVLLAGAIATLSADIVTAIAKLRTQVGLRDSYPQRLADLSARIDALAEAEERTVAAYARAAEKIANPGLPPRPAAAAVLRARLADLDRLHAAGEWRRLAEDAGTVGAGTDRATARAGELIAAADGLLARRDELRGRLAAYQAKAALHRLDEAADLATLHTAARTLLYTAPCDLQGATQAVFAYQHALTATLAATTGAGSDRRDQTR